MTPLRMTYNFTQRVRRQYYFFFLILLLSANSSFAQSFAAYAGEFLQLGTGARSLAMGNAAIVSSNDATVGYWNPAGLSDILYPSIVGMHEARFDNTVQHDFV